MASNNTGEKGNLRETEKSQSTKNVVIDNEMRWDIFGDNQADDVTVAQCTAASGMTEVCNLRRFYTI